jgi:NTE family protein
VSPRRTDSREEIDDLVVSKETRRTERDAPEEGVGLCLSGGGYRAMLFHVGSLWRLAEAGVLAELARISSVSGGSITSAVLALAWDELREENFAPGALERRVVNPVRGLAEKTIDVRAGLFGLITPRRTISDHVRRAYEEILGEKTLADLPDDPPRFVFNATNLQSTVLWRFSKPYAWDYKVGKVDKPTVRLSAVVAASSAFPPFLSPATVPLGQEDFTPQPDDELRQPPYTTNPVLSDGGVYDNLGLETVWKRYRTVLVSDGGGKTKPQPKVGRDWARHSHRVMMTIDNQVRSLRKRALIASYQDGRRLGAYWGIRTDIDNYELERTLDCPFEKTIRLAEIGTRLKKLDDRTQERLINWGYAVCDAALRAHVVSDLDPPGAFPYPGVGVG